MKTTAAQRRNFLASLYWATRESERRHEDTLGKVTVITLPVRYQRHIVVYRFYAEGAMLCPDVQSAREAMKILKEHA